MGKVPKILVVDDSNTNVVLLDVVLVKEGYEVETASNAREALKCIANGVPDLILLDILMPQTNGLELLETIKQDPKYNSIPVIMVTAVGSDEYRRKAARLGALDFFEKPLDVPGILKKIRSIL